MCSFLFLRLLLVARRGVMGVHGQLLQVRVLPALWRWHVLRFRARERLWMWLGLTRLLLWLRLLQSAIIGQHVSEGLGVGCLGVIVVSGDRYL